MGFQRLTTLISIRLTRTEGVRKEAAQSRDRDIASCLLLTCYFSPWLRLTRYGSRVISHTVHALLLMNCISSVDCLIITNGHAWRKELVHLQARTGGVREMIFLLSELDSWFVLDATFTSVFLRGTPIWNIFIVFYYQIFSLERKRIKSKYSFLLWN